MVMALKDKIRLYKSPNCAKCAAAKFIVQRILINKGLHYDEVVEEKDVEKDRDAMAELLMHDTINTPLIIIGKAVLKDEDATKEQFIREAVENWLRES